MLQKNCENEIRELSRDQQEKLKDGSIMQAAEFANTHEGMCVDCYKATRLNVA